MFKAGKIYPYLISEDEPEMQKNTFLHRIVANNFKALVLDSTYDALVIFDSDQCQQCKTLRVMYEEIAERMQNNRFIKFYFINTSKNEVLGMKPTQKKAVVRFFAQRDKTQPIDFSRFRKSREIISQLERKTSQKWYKPIDIK